MTSDTHSKRVILFGNPRSGTSWLGALIASHPNVNYRFQPIHSYSFNGILKEDSSLQDLDRFFNELAESNDEYVTSLSFSPFDKKLLNHFSKNPTHILFKEVHDFLVLKNGVKVDSSIKLIGLVRDPVSVISSWINTPNEWDESWEISHEWLDAPHKNSEYSGNHFGVSQWIFTTQQLLELSNLYPRQVLIVRYEDLVKQPELELTEVFGFLGLSYPSEVKHFLEQTRLGESHDRYSVFRGLNKGQNSRNLPESIHTAIIEEVKRHSLEEFFCQ